MQEHLAAPVASPGPSTFTRAMAVLLFSAPRREELLKAYAYFRWLDDLVDDPRASLEQTRAAVASAQLLIESCYVGVPIDLRSHEVHLAEVLRHDASSGRLNALCTDFVAALAWDAMRRGQVRPRVELLVYSERLGRAYAQGLLYGYGLDPRAPAYEQAATLAGSAAQLAHVVRDLEIDLSLGYCNASEEDVARYNLDPWDVAHPGWAIWRAETAARARALFAQARPLARLLPPGRARLGYRLVCAKYDRLAARWAGS